MNSYSIICGDTFIPNTPLSTLTTGKVEIPRETSVASLIVPVKYRNQLAQSSYTHHLSTSLDWIEQYHLKQIELLLS